MTDKQFPQNEGGSDDSILPKINTPIEETLIKKDKEDQIIDIGMPKSAEELKRLKEDAEKLD